MFKRNQADEISKGNVRPVSGQVVTRVGDSRKPADPAHIPSFLVTEPQSSVVEPAFVGQPDPIETMLEDGVTAFMSNDAFTPRNDPLSDRHSGLVADMIKAFEAKEADIVRQINTLQTDLAEVRKTLDGYRQAHAVFVAPTILPAPQE